MFINEEMIHRYVNWLYESEKSRQTIAKYDRYLRRFYEYLSEETFEKDLVITWKNQLKREFAPVTVNGAIAALNGYLKYMGWSDDVIHYLKIKKCAFCPEQKELKREEYEELVRTARSAGNERLALILQTVCSTGIRISELQYITVEAIEKQCVMVECKGKVRTVFLTTKLCGCLKQYCQKRGIASGMIFVTRNGKMMDRSNIWREMKRLGKQANVLDEKIFPHNLRHLFARVYYDQEKDLSRLADILGHCSVNTTRIYTMKSGEKHIQQLEKLNLIIQENNGIYLLL